MEGYRDAFIDTLGISASKYRLDKEFTLLCANQYFYESMGYTESEYQTLFPSFSQYYQKHTKEFLKIRDTAYAAFQNGDKTFTLDCRTPQKGNGCRWVRMTGTITQEQSGDCPVLLAVYTDIHDIISARDEKSRYFEWMMDEYVGNVYICDMETYELLFVNTIACETLQSHRESIVGRKCYEVIQGRTSPCPFCTNDKLREDEFYQWEFNNPVLKRTFMIKNRIVNWKGRKARIELSHDMYSTEYKLAKKDRERESLLRTIPGGFVRIDARDCQTILWYGAEFLQVIGYTKEQLEKELHFQCTYIHPEDKSRVTAVMQKIRETGESAVIEARVISHSGELKILTMTLCYISGENSWDGIPSYYRVGIDVTQERKEQERQRLALEDAYRTAQVASSAKTNFLSSMSHDIRTPMNAIMGMAAIAQVNLDSPEKVHDCLNKINVSSRHLLSLINEVLDMSKIESGKIDLMPEEVNLPELTQNVADMCKPLIAEKQLEFQISVGQVRHEKIVADGDRLHQVFMNLLSNAIKYTPNGGKISLFINELPSLNPEKARFEFVIQDNGIGMNSDYIPHIFEPFSRAEDPRISKIQGTGLGMAITENIVRMMNGSIDVKSRPGEGSQFTVSVQFEWISEEEVCEKELEGLPVLVVDDDKIVCENATALLNELGMRGFWVLSGLEAVECVAFAHSRKDDFFAVILDWQMPEMDGLETLKAIREQLGEHVPIIIISAYDYSDIEDEFVRAGADAFITKPLFKSKMLHVLQLFLSTSRQDALDDPAENKHPGLPGKHILLAEDNDLNREIAAELLEMQGITVDAVENGRHAVEAFQASLPGYYDAVLMDIQMPEMDGYIATETIRSMKRIDAHTIPILALTANAFVADVGKARSVGMNDHIAKPIDVEQLMNVLQRWIG